MSRRIVRGDALIRRRRNSTDRTDRGFLIPALFGLIVTCIGLGTWAGLVIGGWHQPTQYPSYREASQPQGVNPSNGSTPASSEARRPCLDPRSREDSDLCAQWRAAEGAHNGADWAFIQLWLTLASIVGLGVTIWLNFEAWRQARRSESDTASALAHSQNIAEATVAYARVADETLLQAKQYEIIRNRPYLLNKTFLQQPTQKSDGSPVVNFVVEFVNNGNTPALTARMFRAGEVRGDNMMPIFAPNNVGMTAIIGPESRIETVNFPVSDDDYDLLVNRGGTLWLYARATYTGIVDPAGDYATECCYRIKLGQKLRKADGALYLNFVGTVAGEQNRFS